MAGFLIETVLISLSGVMAPGPLTATAVAKGAGSPHAGGLIALGHGIVEFPLMLAMFWGLGSVLANKRVGAIVGFVGGFFLLVLGVGIIRSASAEAESKEGFSSPVLAGALLSIGNPYFLVWWATVGASLLSRAMGFGWPGFLAFAILHWACDLGWLYLLSWLSSTGRAFLGTGFVKAVRLLCGVLLVFFGAKFVADALLALL